jgi:hypothetical protein
MAKNQLPVEIIDDITNCLQSHALPRMARNADGGSGRGTYTVRIDQIPVEFHNAELAPPSGVMAANYAR